MKLRHEKCKRNPGVKAQIDFFPQNTQFKKFEVNDLRNIIIKNILNKKNFKKLNIDIHKNKRYLLTPLESAKKFVKLI